MPQAGQPIRGSRRSRSAHGQLKVAVAVEFDVVEADVGGWDVETGVVRVDLESEVGRVAHGAADVVGVLRGGTHSVAAAIASEYTPASGSSRLVIVFPLVES